jgi:hypothetical protein
VAKTESTAVTRLIELAHSRPIDPEIGTRIDVDWFGAPMGKPKRLERPKMEAPRDEITKVVRVPGRRVVASPAMVVGAFVAGVLSVAVTMLVTRSDAEKVATTPTPETEMEMSKVATTLPLPSPSRSTSTTTTTSTPTPTPVTTVVAAVPEPEPVAVAVAVPAQEEPAPKAVERPTRPARTHAPAALTRPRVGRPAAVREGGGPLAELRVNSKPPCQLYIDGRDMGWTPQRGISVPPGRHTVEFRNREMGVERKVIVDAKVGEIHRVIRDFTEP